MERKLREARSDLVVCGKGIILFAVWGLVKTLLAILYDSTGQSLREQFNTFDTAERIAGIIAVAIVFAIYLAIYVYVGKSAISEARGKRKGRFYLFLAVVLMIISILTIAIAAVSWWGNKGNLTYIASIILEITFIIAVKGLLSSVKTIRNADKTLASAQTENTEE